MVISFSEISQPVQNPCHKCTCSSECKQQLHQVCVAQDVVKGVDKPKKIQQMQWQMVASKLTPVNIHSEHRKLVMCRLSSIFTSARFSIFIKREQSLWDATTALSLCIVTCSETLLPTPNVISEQGFDPSRILISLQASKF